MVAMDVAAEKATELPKLGRPRMKLNAHTSQTIVEQTQKNDLSACDIPNAVRGNMKRRTGTDRRTPPMVHFVQEFGAWDRTVAAKCVQHPRVRCY